MHKHDKLATNTRSISVMIIKSGSIILIGDEKRINEFLHMGMDAQVAL